MHKWMRLSLVQRAKRSTSYFFFSCCKYEVYMTGFPKWVYFRRSEADGGVNVGWTGERGSSKWTFNEYTFSGSTRSSWLKSASGWSPGISLLEAPQVWLPQCADYSLLPTELCKAPTSVPSCGCGLARQSGIQLIFKERQLIFRLQWV